MYKKGDKYIASRQLMSHCFAVTREGMELIITSDSEIPYFRSASGSCAGHSEDFKTCKKVGRTMEDLQQGDIVTDENRDLEVQGTIGKIVFVIDMADGEAETWALDELKEAHYKIKTEPEMTEMTLEEVAKMKGVPVEQLRIKD